MGVKTEPKAKRVRKPRVAPDWLVKCLSCHCGRGMLRTVSGFACCSIPGHMKLIRKCDVVSMVEEAYGLACHEGKARPDSLKGALTLARLFLRGKTVTKPAEESPVVKGGSSEGKSSV